MNQCVIGWTSLYPTVCKTSPFTEERKKALVERIRKRKYNFTFDNYQYLPYCCPVFEDNTICVLTKQQFDKVMDEAWGDIPVGKRLIPMDVITIPVKNGVLFEKEKFIQKENEQNV